MVAEYESFFSSDFGLLYTEFPGDLWEILLPKATAKSSDDLIIDLFQAWKLFWEHQTNLFEESEKYVVAKNSSYQDFQQMVETVQNDPDNFLTKASNLDEVSLLPVIALTIRSIYPSITEFYKDCVRIMTSVFFDQIGDGEFFIRVGPNAVPMPEDQIFYIYTVDVDF
jgi:hypothetical protein